MTHVTPSTPRARVTAHAVRRYAERVLGQAVNEAVADDAVACLQLRGRGVDLAAIRARIRAVGGVLLQTGARTGDVVAFPEAMKFRVVDGVVVTVLARVAKLKPAGPASPVPARPRTVLEVGEASA